MAQALKENLLFREIMTELKAMYFEKLTKVKKDSSDNYLLELSDIHDSMQNLTRIESYIDRCIVAGKVVRNKGQRPDINA